MTHVRATETDVTPPFCPRCRATTLHKHGSRAGPKRWKCPACGKTCTEATFQPRPDKPGDLSVSLVILIDLFSHRMSSCRALAAMVGVSHSRIHRLRTRILAHLASRQRPALLWTRLVDVAATCLRDNRKGSRDWQRHATDPAAHPRPDREQWHAYGAGGPPAAIAERFRVTLIFDADRAGHLDADLLDAGEGALVAALAPRRPGAVAPLVAHGACVAPAVAPRPGTALRSRLTTVADLATRFRTFHRQLRGVATRSLPLYLTLFLLRATRGLS